MAEIHSIKNRELILEKLKMIPFLQSFKKDYLGEILAKSRIRQYDEDELIIPEGAYDKSIYILIMGEVKVTKQGAEIARMKHSGDIFGELAMINDDVRSASVYANQLTHCLIIDTTNFNTMDTEERTAIYSIIYRIFAEILADRLRDTSEELARTQDELQQTKDALDRFRKLTT